MDGSEPHAPGRQPWPSIADYWPDAPKPGAPKPGAPKPEALASDAAKPGAPKPGAPAPGSRTPVAQPSVEPAPGAWAPGEPSPGAWAPGEPMPRTWAPGEPAPGAGAPAGGHLVTPGLLRARAEAPREAIEPIPQEPPSWEQDTEGYDVLGEDDDPPPPPSAVIGSGRDDGRAWKPILALVAALVFLAGSGVVLAGLVSSRRDEPTAAAPPDQPAQQAADAGDPSPPVSIAPEPTTPPEPTAPSATPTTPAHPRTATFELASDTTSINLSVKRLDSGLFRLSTPDGSGVTPRAELNDGTLRLTVDRADRNGSGRVDVVLDDRTTWSVKMTGGVRRASFDLSAAASVPRIDFAGGARVIDLRLPALSRVVPIRMTGGVHRWTIRTTGEVPVRARLRDGAGEVVLNGDREKGVAKGSTLTAAVKDAEAGGGLDVDAVAGVGTLTVTKV